MKTRFVVVVLGGYGHFGAIIAARIAAIDGIDVVIAGRSAEKAEACAHRIGAQARAIDIHTANLRAEFATLGANLVVSAAGPFHGKDYRVARAAIAAGAHYIDIADAREFVCGITALDVDAKNNEVIAVSGASSVPALAAAAVDYLAGDFGSVRSIRHGISTSGKVPGVATVAAVLSYCGRPYPQWQERKWRTLYGWQDLTRYVFSSKVGVRWLANCNVPDLELFPQRYRGVEAVQFQAGVDSTISVLGLRLLSWAVRAGLIRNATNLAPALHRLGSMMAPAGSGSSGMFVEITGFGKDGGARSATWEVIALNDHGPQIPCMAAVVLTRKIASGKLNVTGAMPCVGLITLDEYLMELEGFDIAARETRGG